MASTDAPAVVQKSSEKKESEEEKRNRLEIEDKARKDARVKARRNTQRGRDARDAKTMLNGCFSFQIQSVKLNIDPQKTLTRVGLSFDIVREDGSAAPQWWEAPKPVSGSVAKSGEVILDRACLGTTKKFNLTEEFVTELLTKKMCINIYEIKSEILNSATDMLLGRAEIAFIRMLVEDQPQLSLSSSLIRSENPKAMLADDESKISVLLTCDDELAEYVLGGCVFSCGPLKLVNPPPSWTLEQIEIETEDGNKTTQSRSPIAIKEMMDAGKLGLSFALEVVADGLIPSLQFNPGVVSYMPPPPSPQPGSKSNSRDFEAVDSPVKTKGDWEIKFESPAKKFLARQNLTRIQRSIADGECIELLLTRSKERLGGTEESTPSDIPWTLVVKADVSELLVPDIKQCEAMCSLSQLPYDDQSNLSKNEYSRRELEVREALRGDQSVEEATRLQCHFPVAMSRSFQQATVEVEYQYLSADDVVPPRRVHVLKPVRKFEDDVRSELTDMVRTVCAEYEVLFSGAKLKPLITVKDRGAQLLEVLATAGVRHDFMERLKPVVQRAVTTRFGRSPSNQEEKDKYMTELYSWLMSCISQILGTYYAPMVADEQAEIARQRKQSQQSQQSSSSVNGGEEHSQEVAEILEQLEDLRVVSIDQEAMGEWDSAMIKNEDRVTLVVNWLAANPENSWVASDVWYSFGQFCLRAAVYEGPTSPKFSDLRGKAVESLTEAYFLNPSNAEVLKMLGAIQLEQGRYEKAAEVLYDALDLETPSIGKRRRSLSDEPPVRTLAQAAEPEPLTSILMCLYFTTIGNYVSAGEFLGHAVRAYKHRGLQAPGKPRRTGSLLALEASEFLVNAALPGLATRALELAAKCEAASIAKAAGVVKTKPTPGNAAARIAAAKQAKIEATEKVLAEGGEGAEPECIAQQRLRVSVKIALLNHNHVSALPLAEQASKHDPQDAESWSLLGDAQYAAGASQWEAAAHAYSKAISIINKTVPSKPPPLRLLVRLGALYLNLNRFEDAKKTYLMGAGSWQTCSMWLGVGIALLRLESFGEAETALQEANIRNNRSGAVWGYMCLLCLNSGSNRLTQADHAREVAERLGLNDAVLLRELGNAYTSLDRLETAEGLYRRSLAVDENNSHTRRRLADVLSAQNAVADAVNEYYRVIETVKEKYGTGMSNITNEDRNVCLDVIEQCKRLLKTLGRSEEFALLRPLRSSLQSR